MEEEDIKLWKRYRSLKESKTLKEVYRELGFRSKPQCVNKFIRSFLNEYVQYEQLTLDKISEAMGIPADLVVFLLDDEINHHNVNLVIDRKTLMKWQQMKRKYNQSITSLVRTAMINLDADLNSGRLFTNAQDGRIMDELAKIQSELARIDTQKKHEEEDIDSIIEETGQQNIDIPNLENHKQKILDLISKMGPMTTKSLSTLLGFDEDHITFYILSIMNKKQIKLNIEEGKWHKI